MSNVNLKELADNLRAAASAYYESDSLLMSDAEYDSGIEQLKMAAAEDPSLAAEVDDLLNQVAAGQSGGGDVEHPTLMGSMTKVASLDAIKDLVKKIEGPMVVEPKLDGLALRAVYDSGNLSLVATRGDGTTGEDVTARVRNLAPKGLPLKLDVPESFEVRGEVYLADEDFPTANKVRVDLGGAEFVNSRNAAAGMLRKGDMAFAGLMSFAAYEVSGEDSSYNQRRTHVKSLGFATAGSLVTDLWSDEATVSGTNDVLERVDKLDAARAELGFPIDGVVIKANNAADRERLGMGSKAPRWAAAYKYEAEEAQTVVQSITTDVGKTGRLSITLHVDPVFISGTTVARASGHNARWMLEKDIRVGDTVMIRRANDVIPYVSEVVLDARPDDSKAWEPPTTDPLGNEWDKSTELWRSTSPELSVQGRLSYGVSRDALDIEGLGDVVITALIENGLANDIADLFDLNVEQLAELDLGSGRQLGSKNAEKIVNEINKARDAAWHRVITALTLRGTGRTMSRRLAKVFTTMESLRAASTAELAGVDGVGPKKADMIHEGLQTLSDMLDRLEKAGVNMGEEEDADDAGEKPLDGETVVVTGKVPGLTRTEVAERVEALGGRSSGSVSSSTTLLVAEEGSTSSKVKKAEKLGIKMMTPEEFSEL